MDVRAPAAALLACLLMSACGNGQAASFAVPAAPSNSADASPTGDGRATAAVRPGNGMAMQAHARGVLRADATTGCLWLEGPDGVGREVLLQGDSYRVDFDVSPVVIRDGERVVAEVGTAVDMGGGFTPRVDGVEGCPAEGGPFLGYFEG